MDSSTTNPEIGIPEPLFSDYVEMTYLGLVLIIGVPINLHVLFKLLKQKQKSASYSVKRGFLLMKINLNISDTLILFINAGGKLGWLVTYEWKMGDSMCRLFKYLSIGSLYLSSNIVVCIALDRLRTVLSAQQLRREHSVLLTKIILVFAWLIALISSVPQFFVFQIFDVLQFSEESWYQCTDIWAVQEHLVSIGAINESQEFPYNEGIKNLHEISHLFMVFYGPLIIMAICYFIIAVKLTKYSKGYPQNGSGGTTEPMIASGTGRSLKPMMTQMSRVENSKYSVFGETEIEPSVVHEVLSQKTSIEEKIEKKNKFSKLLKNEFSYCICIQNDEKMNPKLSARSAITEDGMSNFSVASTPMFTWTPTLSKKRNSYDTKFERKTSTVSREIQKLIWKKGQIRELTSAVPRQPAWRRQLRSRVFKTTLLVVVTHIIFWLPYNFISLLRFVSEDAHTRMRNHMNIFEDMQFLIALVNPFLYGFGESLSKY